MARKRKTKRRSTKTLETSFDEAVLSLSETTELLVDIGDAAVLTLSQQLSQIANTIKLDQCTETTDVKAAMEVVVQGAGIVFDSLSGQDDAVERAELASHELAENFPELLDQQVDDQPWFTEETGEDVGDELIDEDPIAPSAAEIGALINQLRAEPDVAVEFSKTQEPQACDSEDHTAEESVPETVTADEEPLPAPQSAAVEPTKQPDIHPELREAFLDDAGSCLASMEKALLTLDENPDSAEPLRVLGRELHTLKGASGSVGLSGIADFIHDVEEKLRVAAEASTQPSQQELFGYFDEIQRQVGQIQAPTPTQDPVEPKSKSSAPPVQQSNPEPTAPKQHVDFDDHQSDDETVRIKASRLNRLMDMLSELVMLRNDRDSELAKLEAINETLLDNAARLRLTGQDQRRVSRLGKPSSDGDLDDGTMIAEIANDLLGSAQELRDCFQPVVDGNQAVSQFIRNFRQELVQIRRTPITGLVQRLRRAVSDAARAEQKQVRLEVRGEQTGIERSLQSRIFEPLLHVVRNAVSHGIETPETRAENGKPPVGTITLHAHSGPDLLVIEIRDDGGGLDYEAIRRRATDRGLISGGSSTSDQELAQLIFHPGFSTSESVTQISGRGVGMDVVASTLRRMRGWIEIESKPGSGTSIQLSIPLPSMIQHAMIFRAGNQLFAVPMQSVQRAGDAQRGDRAVQIQRMLGMQPSRVDQPKMIVLASSNAEAIESQTAILVDEIIGPEEVVVRPLPKMVRQHPLCSGATVSSRGEVVLLLDAASLMETRRSLGEITDETPKPSNETQCVLVVDDSNAARMRVCQSLARYDVQIVQAKNGSEALDLIKSQQFAAVLSDIDMPRMNGLELLSEIKGHPDTEHLPVVLISSRTEESITQRAKKTGAAACLAKPLADESLDRVLSTITPNIPAFTFPSN